MCFAVVRARGIVFLLLSSMKLLFAQKYRLYAKERSAKEMTETWWHSREQRNLWASPDRETRPVCNMNLMERVFISHSMIYVVVRSLRYFFFHWCSFKFEYILKMWKSWTLIEIDFKFSGRRNYANFSFTTSGNYKTKVSGRLPFGIHN